MIFLIFLFIIYDTAIIQLLLWKIFLISLLLQAFNEVSQINIFLVFFFYIWSSKVISIFIIIRIWFSSVKFNINWLLLFFIVFSKLLLLYLIKFDWQLIFQLPNFFNGIYETLCVFTAFLLQDQSILMRFPTSKLIYGLFLIYS